MDQCMIDVSHIKDVKIGDEVILMGEDMGIKMTAEEIGNLLGTINYGSNLYDKVRGCLEYM